MAGKSKEAKENAIPVLVECETYKYAEGVVLDSFGRNELGLFLRYGLLEYCL